MHLNKGYRAGFTGHPKWAINLKRLHLNNENRDGETPWLKRHIRPSGDHGATLYIISVKVGSMHTLNIHLILLPFLQNGPAKGEFEVRRKKMICPFEISKSLAWMSNFYLKHLRAISLWEMPENPSLLMPWANYITRIVFQSRRRGYLLIFQ